MRNIFVVTKNTLGFNSLGTKIREPSASGCGMAAVFGDRGGGKSTTAISYTQRNLETTVLIRMRALWTARGFLEELIRELKQEPAHKTTDLLRQIMAVLKRKRPLVIIDEADYLLKEATRIETVRDLYDTCLTPFLLIGMAGFERKIHRVPQVVDRIRDNFLEFTPLDREDVARIAVEICEVKLSQDALNYIAENTDGSIRQVETFVRMAERIAAAKDIKEIGARELAPHRVAEQVREALARSRKRLVPRGAPVLHEPAGAPKAGLGQAATV
jgi:hypothetical protein